MRYRPPKFRQDLRIRPFPFKKRQAAPEAKAVVGPAFLFSEPLGFANLEPERPEVMGNLLKTQSVSSKLAKLKHDLEFDAGKLSDRIDSVAGRKDAAFAKGHQFLDTTEGHIGKVEEFVKDLEAATNGEPA